MKYALDSFFFQGEILSFFGGLGISECMGMYPFILREDDGSEGKIDPRFGFTVFSGRWTTNCDDFLLCFLAFVLPPSILIFSDLLGEPSGWTNSFFRNVLWWQQSVEKRPTFGQEYAPKHEWQAGSWS